MKELRISQGNPDSLGAYAEWAQGISGGGYASIINQMTGYPESLNLKTNPGLLSADDISNQPMLSKTRGLGSSIENENPKEYIRRDMDLICRLLKPFDGKTPDFLIFAEEADCEVIGHYGAVSFTLWSLVIRISVIDSKAGALIARRNVLVEEGPERVLEPKPSEDGRYYLSVDEWELFLESFFQ